MTLDTLLQQRADIWRGGEMPPAVQTSIPSGFPALDELMPGGGWPQGALTEILVDQPASGVMQLVLPALARLSDIPRWQAWIAPPHIPYAPALAQAGIALSRVLWVHPGATRDSLWAVEQALQSGTCSVVLAWLTRTDTRVMRRLQLAAEAGQTWGVLFCPTQAAATASPAALRLRVEPAQQGLDVHVLKRRGGWATGPVHISNGRHFSS